VKLDYTRHRLPKLFSLSSRLVSIRTSCIHILKSNTGRTRRRPENTSWTGHYIPDPTLAYTIGLIHHCFQQFFAMSLTNCMPGRPWTMGRYQSYGFAKVWEGTARLPPPEWIDDGSEGPDRGTGSYFLDMWLGEGAYRLYRKAVSHSLIFGIHLALFRRYITWLNAASLEHGGRFIGPPPIEYVP
jgi:hypothetical protein